MAYEEEMEEKKVVKPPEPVYYKVFLNDMNSRFNRFIIENIRSDLKKDLLINDSFMDMVQSNERRLPDLFTPEIIKMDYNDHYKAKLFENDISKKFKNFLILFNISELEAFDKPPNIISDKTSPEPVIKPYIFAESFISLVVIPDSFMF